MTDQLPRLSLSELHGLFDALCGSADPYAVGAMRFVKAEIVLRGRSKRETNGLTKRHCYGRERARGNYPLAVTTRWRVEA